MAGLSVPSDEIAQGGSSCTDRSGEGRANRQSEPLAACHGNVSSGRERTDARKEQTFIRVDVADSNDSPSVHQELFDRGTMAQGHCVQASAGKLIRQRFDAQMGKQRMGFAVRRPEDGSEAARVVQPQQYLAKADVHVVVLANRRVGRDDPQAARHPKMDDQVAIPTVEDQVFRAPRHILHALPGEALDNGRYRPAQAWLAHGNR